jgi:dihydrofolate synthase / folylpolyglutamate synthase
MYTSPHLLRFTERIRVNGKEIPEAAVLDFLSEHWDFIQAQHCTYFETATALAMDYFRRTKIHVAVVEVGLGGRYDATRIVQTILSIITRIDLDHTDRLGNSLEEIAKDKAGIFHTGASALTGRQHPQVARVLKEAAADLGANYYLAEQQVALSDLTLTPRSITGKAAFLTGTAPDSIFDWKMPLTGSHQIENLNLSLAACTLLKERFPDIITEAVREGIRRVRWPGRLQVLKNKPTLIVDVAHNPAAVRAVLQSVQDLWKPKKLTVIFSALRDKDVAQMMTQLQAQAHEVILVPLQPPRGYSFAEITALFRQSGWRARTATSTEAALRDVLAGATPDDIVLALGSHHLVEEVIKNQNIS